MVVGKLMHHQSAMSSSSCGTSNNCGYDGYEIRSGMSVQDLKQLTAHRQCMEFWEQQARNSPRQVGSPSDWSSASLSSSPGSTSSLLSSSSSASGSPPRAQLTPVSHLYQPQGATAFRYSAGYGPVAVQSPPVSADKMFVTYGGQVVSFMEGVVNAPQIDCLPDMLAL